MKFSIIKALSTTATLAREWARKEQLETEAADLFLELKAAEAALAAEPAHAQPAALIRVRDQLKQELEYTQLELAAA